MLFALINFEGVLLNIVRTHECFVERNKFRIYNSKLNERNFIKAVVTDKSDYKTSK